MFPSHFKTVAYNFNRIQNLAHYIILIAENFSKVFKSLWSEPLSISPDETFISITRKNPFNQSLQTSNASATVANWIRALRYASDLVQNGTELPLCNLLMDKAEVVDLSVSRLLEVLKWYVNPSLAVIGFILNMFCIAILKADGFKKPSNILLLVVVISGSFHQISAVNVPEIIEYMTGKKMYQYKEHLCFRNKDFQTRVLHIPKYIFYFFGYWGEATFAQSYLLITLERFVAIFLPLKFRILINRRNIFILNIILFLVWLPWVVFKLYVLFRLDEVLENKLKLSKLRDLVNLMKLTLYTSYLCHVIQYINHLIPLHLVILGNIAIAIKITLILRKRNNLTSERNKFKWSRQISKTLLITCLAFSVSDSLSLSVNHIMATYFKATDVTFLLETDLSNFFYMIITSSLLFIFISINKSFLNQFYKILNRLFAWRALNCFRCST